MSGEDTDGKVVGTFPPGERIIFIVFRYETIDQVDCLQIGMVTTRRSEAEEFMNSDPGDWKLREANDGDYYPI